MFSPSWLAVVVAGAVDDLGGPFLRLIQLMFKATRKAAAAHAAVM